MIFLTYEQCLVHLIGVISFIFQISISYSHTIGTRVRLSLMRSVSKRQREKDPKAICSVSSFTPRPMLRVGVKDQGTRFLSFVDAMNGFRHLLTTEDLDKAASMCQGLEGHLRSRFLVLSDDRQPPPPPNKKRPHSDTLGTDSVVVTNKRFQPPKSVPVTSTRTPANSGQGSNLFSPSAFPPLQTGPTVPQPRGTEDGYQLVKGVRRHSQRVSSQTPNVSRTVPNKSTPLQTINESSTGLTEELDPDQVGSDSSFVDAETL